MPLVPATWNENSGPDCCHRLIRRPRPITGCVRSRASPGGMSAHSRAGSHWSMNAGACMKPDFGKFRGLCRPFCCPSSSCEITMAKPDPEINNTFSHHNPPEPTSGHKTSAQMPESSTSCAPRAEAYQICHTRHFDKILTKCRSRWQSTLNTGCFRPVATAFRSNHEEGIRLIRILLSWSGAGVTFSHAGPESKREGPALPFKPRSQI